MSDQGGQQPVILVVQQSKKHKIINESYPKKPGVLIGFLQLSLEGKSMLGSISVTGGGSNNESQGSIRFLRTPYTFRSQLQAISVAFDLFSCKKRTYLVPADF